MPILTDLHIFLLFIIIIIIIIIKKGRQWKAKTAIYTLSVQRPQHHNTYLYIERRERRTCTYIYRPIHIHTRFIVVAIEGICMNG